MSPETRAALLRWQASLHDRAAGHLRAAAAATITADKMRQFVEAMQYANDRELSSHPDLAELNVQMDGYYEGGER